MRADEGGSYLSSKLAGHADSTQGQGLFATQRLAKGELLVRWAGRLVSRARFNRLAPEIQSISLQVDDDQFLVPTQPCAADRVNHSCEPNAGMRGPVALVALRVIEAGEEITYDYAMSDGSDYDEFTCSCGTQSCRGRVSGQDWLDARLRVRYAGHFSPYLERRMSSPGRRSRAARAPAGTLGVRTTTLL